MAKLSILIVPYNLTDESIKKTKAHVMEFIGKGIISPEWLIRKTFDFAYMDTHQLAAIELALDFKLESLAFELMEKMEEMEVQNG